MKNDCQVVYMDHKDDDPTFDPSSPEDLAQAQSDAAESDDPIQQAARVLAPLRAAEISSLAERHGIRPDLLGASISCLVATLDVIQRDAAIKAATTRKKKAAVAKPEPQEPKEPAVPKPWVIRLLDIGPKPEELLGVVAEVAGSMIGPTSVQVLRKKLMLGTPRDLFIIPADQEDGAKTALYIRGLMETAGAMVEIAREVE